jgi:UDP-GlcNAc:undecaprenyl-phosphate GlcNAc-1-phosphate transferase
VSTDVILAIIVACCTTWLAMLAVLPFLTRFVSDVPNARSSHVQVTPRGGGIAVVAGTFAALILMAWRGGEAFGSGVLLTAVLAFALTGFADDLWSLPVRVRLLGQLLFASVIAVEVLGPLSGWTSGLLVVTVLVGVAGFVNAFNFMDGINGISGVTAAVAGAWFTWVGLTREIDALTVAGASLASASIVFLYWNLRGRVFLGDVGSYFIGAAIAVMAVSAWRAGTPLMIAIAPTVLYLTDTSVTLLHRFRAGKRIGEAHREHTYQRVVDRGVSHVAMALAAGGATVAVCLGSLLSQWAPLAGALAWAACMVVYLCLPRWSPRFVGGLLNG